MIPDINPHNRTALDFSISSQRARLLKSSSRLTAYSIDPIERNLGRIILDISGHNLAEPDVQISTQKMPWGAPFEIFQSIQSLQF